jgi:hypothetical protein
VELLFCKTAMRILSNQRVVEYESLHAVIRDIINLACKHAVWDGRRLRRNGYRKGTGGTMDSSLRKICRGLVVVPRGRDDTNLKASVEIYPKIRREHTRR